MLLADVMTIADECDSQLKQTNNSFIGQASQVATQRVMCRGLPPPPAINREARR
jgi:ornithine carbamoyltransferase